MRASPTPPRRPVSTFRRVSVHHVGARQTTPPPPDLCELWHMAFLIYGSLLPPRLSLRPTAVWTLSSVCPARCIILRTLRAPYTYHRRPPPSPVASPRLCLPPPPFPKQTLTHPRHVVGLRPPATMLMANLQLCVAHYCDNPRPDARHGHRAVPRALRRLSRPALAQAELLRRLPPPPRTRPRPAAGAPARPAAPQPPPPAARPPPRLQLPPHLR